MSLPIADCRLPIARIVRIGVALCALLFALCSVVIAQQPKKVTELPTATSAGANDVLMLTKFPFDSSSSKKITFNNFVLSITLPWNRLDKTGSSLAHLSTRSASDLSSGTINSARLPTITMAMIEGGSASPGNSKYYGTNSSGTKGFFDLPSGGGGAVDSVFGRTGAVVAATNDYTWNQVNKATSSLADITTRSASDLSSGALPTARLDGGSASPGNSKYYGTDGGGAKGFFDVPSGGTAGPATLNAFSDQIDLLGLSTQIPVRLGGSHGTNAVAVNSHQPTISFVRYDTTTGAGNGTTAPYFFGLVVKDGGTKAAYYNLMGYAISSDTSPTNKDIVGVAGHVTASLGSTTRAYALYGEAAIFNQNAGQGAVGAELGVVNASGVDAGPLTAALPAGFTIGLNLVAKGGNLNGAGINFQGGGTSAFRTLIHIAGDNIAAGGYGMDFAFATRGTPIRLGNDQPIVGYIGGLDRKLIQLAASGLVSIDGDSQGSIFGGGIRPGLGTFVANTPQLYRTAEQGTVLTAGAGSTFDFLLTDRSGNTLAAVPTGQADLQLGGSAARVLLGAGAPATTATTGFAYMGAMAGVPTGVPGASTGFAPLIFDSANNRLYVYNSGWQNLTGGSGGAVDSVFGRTGAVVAATNDYTWAQIQKASSSLADITTRSAADLSSGTLPDGRFPATLPAINGSLLTNLNASSLASGAVPTARLDGGSASPGNSKYYGTDGTGTKGFFDLPSGGGAVDSVFGRTGAVVAATNDYTWAQIQKASSSLADITTRSASDLSSGTLPDARFPSTLPAVNGSLLTTLNASNLASGTLADARFPSTLPAINGSLLTTLNASNLASGTVDAARLPTRTHKIWLAAAGCNNATAASFWDLPTSTPAAPACVTGTNTQKGVLDFADTSGGFTAQSSFLLPADFTSTIDAKVIWTTTATTGNAKWSLSTICTATDATETDDPAFNTASTVTTAAAGTANRVQTSAITSLTITGCAAGESLHLRLFRDGNDASDTIAATARVFGVELTVRRTP